MLGNDYDSGNGLEPGYIARRKFKPRVCNVENPLDRYFNFSGSIIYNESASDRIIRGCELDGILGLEL